MVSYIVSTPQWASTRLYWSRSTNMRGSISILALASVLLAAAAAEAQNLQEGFSVTWTKPGESTRSAETS